MGYKDKIRRVIPYVPGEQPQDENMVKLNTNENPYPPAPGVREAIESIQTDRYRLYPDPAAEKLTGAIAKHFQVEGEQVFVGVGSDDVLAMIFLTFFNDDKEILFPDITYSFYDVWAELFRIPYRQIPLDQDFCIIPSDYYGDKVENGGIIFPNPNAPTGTALSLSAIEDIVRHNPDSIVVVDEAYVDFGAKSALPLLAKYENLIITQTYSKSRALAGMRIGYAIASKELISYLNDVKYSFNSYTMDTATIEAGAASIRDNEYFIETTGKIIETREWTKKELLRLGFTFGDSKANFIFAAHEAVPAKTIFEKLKEQHIYVRYFNKPRIDNYLRITIGTKQEMETLIWALAKIIQQHF